MSILGETMRSSILIALLFTSTAFAQDSQPTSQATSAPTSAPTSVPVEPTSVPAVKPKAEPKKEEKLPKDLAAGFAGKVNIHALIQAWFDSNQAADKFDAEPEGTFRLRRAEVRLSGDVVPKKLSYVFAADFGKGLFKIDKPVTITNPDGTTTTIQGVQGDNLLPIRDVYAIVKTKYVDGWMGQFKIPLSLEGITSSAQLIFPERSAAAKALGDKRELGVRVEKRQDLYYYGLSLFNGAGENRTDTDNAKDLYARAELTPSFGKNTKLMVGVVGLQSINTEESAIKQAIEGDLRVEVGPALLQGELIGTQNQTAPADDGTRTTKKGLGAAVTAGYTYDRKVQVAGRFGLLDADRDTAAAEDKTQVTELGGVINYFLQQNPKKGDFFTEHPEYHEAKLQLAFSHFTPTNTTDNKVTNEVIAACKSFFKEEAPLLKTFDTPPY
jgi:hypothetical protein